MKIAFWLRTTVAALIIFAVTSSALLYENNGETAPVLYIDRRTPFTLVIDAGHGGEDGGAVSVNGVKESEINLAVAKKIEQITAFFGVSPVQTRAESWIEYPEDAKTIRAKKVADQKARVVTINGINNAVLVSIHQNMFTSASPHGTQVLYTSTNGSSGFAEHMQQLLISGLGQINKRTAIEAPGNIFLMGSINCPGILIECGFLSNRAEAALLENDSYQTKLASVIASGYLSYTSELADELSGISRE